MNKLFNKIAKTIEKSPFKVLFTSLIVIAVLISGATKINMATGNETLVKTDSEAYISNYEMEAEFGGDAMMVLIKGSQDDLLSQENIEKMYNVEQRLKYNDDIHSFLSPASIVGQITNKQTEQIKTNLPEMSKGLKMMSEKLIQVGTELGSKDLPDPSEIEDKLDDLMANIDPSSLMGDMLKSQEADMSKMEAQIGEMGLGLNQIGSKLVEIGKNLDPKNFAPSADLSGSLADLRNISSKFDGLITGQNNLANGLAGINEVPDNLKAIPQNTAVGLTSMQSELQSKLSGLQNSLSDADSQAKMTEMSEGLANMGNQLLTMGQNVSNLPAELAKMTAGIQDPSVMFSQIMSDVESEVAVMKSSLTLGIDPSELKTMADGFVSMGENLAELSEGLEMFEEKSGLMISNIPHNQKELDFILYDEDNKLKEIFSDTVIDEKHVMIMIKLKGNIEDTNKDIVYQQLAVAMDAEYKGEDGNTLTVKEITDENLDDNEIAYLISGKPVLDASLREVMQTNMQYMIVFASLIMVLVLFLVFKVRWPILSIGIVLVSVIGTLGLMGHLSVSMTMVSMAVFPILIGLGIDFSIQFHNRYEEEFSVTDTLTQTGKAISIAVFATMLGFISLYASPVPMIQDFGKMLTIGVVVSFLGSIFLLLPILRIREMTNPSKANNKSKPTLNNSEEDNQNPQKDNDSKDGVMARFLRKTTEFVTNNAILILVFVTVLASLGLYADQKTGVQTDIESFMPQDMAALEDIRYLRGVVGSTEQMVIYMEDEDILSENNTTWMKEKVNEIKAKYPEEIDDVKSIDNLVSNLAVDTDLNYTDYVKVIESIPKNQRSMFINKDATKGAIIINTKHMPTQTLQDFVIELNKDLTDAPMDVTVTGKSVLDIEMIEGLTDGRVKMTLLGIVLVFFGLLVVYRNPFKALVPVIPIILIVGMSGGIMYVLGFKYTPITATLGALILGMGTETTVLVLERYLEERNSGKNRADAMRVTISQIGAATLSTELTTMGGFSVLIFSSFVILKDFGLMTVINVSLTLLSTFLVLPAVIWIFDRFMVKD